MADNNNLLDTAAVVGPDLIARSDTITVSETSTGGLIAAMLLAVPGASAYFKGATVPYSLPSRRHWFGMNRHTVADLEPMSEAIAMRFCPDCTTAIRQHLGFGRVGYCRAHRGALWRRSRH